ncbi:MAG: YihY/virulence factor BrkB family protein [Desulforhopalus sp.]
MTPPQSLKATTGSSLATWADRQVTDCSRFTLAVHYLLRVFLITLTEFKKNELSIRSSALTYAILLSLVPMLAMSTAIVKGLGGGDQLRKAAFTYIETLDRSTGSEMSGPAENSPQQSTQIPMIGTNLMGHLRSALDRLFDYVDRTNFATLGTFGVVGIMVSVLLVLGHIESAMNAIWKVIAARSLLRKVADYLTLMILLPISINIAFAASAFLTSPVLALKMDRFIPFEWLQSLLLKPVPIFFITLTFYLMYIFFPNTKVKTIPAVIGASLAAALWFIVQNVYISLQLGVAKYNAIYGSFATLPLFLVWMYLGWIFILTGAQVAFAFQNEKTYRLVPFSGSPSLKLGAAFDIMDHIYTAFSARRPVTATNLAENLPHYSPPIIKDAVDDLTRAGIIYITQTDDRLFPSAPSEQYDRQKIVGIILGIEAPDTTGGKLSRKAIEAAGTAAV